MGEGQRIHLVERLVATFPSLNDDGYTIESQSTPAYNCIAWAAGDVDKVWWPAAHAYWPEGIPSEERLEAFVLAFQSLGYELSPDSRLEPGNEEVAIYVDSDNVPTHAALQQTDGRWTSKLGKSVDIVHTTTGGVEGNEYGTVAVILKRRRG